MGDPLAGFLEQSPDPLADFTKEEPATTGAPSTKLGGGYGALSAMGSGILSGVEDLGQNLGAIATGNVDLKGAFSAGAEGIGYAVQHPLDTAKGIVWDGILKPLVANPIMMMDPSMENDERTRLAHETTIAAIGLAAGEGIGRALSMVGKGVAAERTLKALTGARDVDGMVNALANMPPSTAVVASKLAQDAMGANTLAKTMIRTTSIGAGSGFAQGVAMSNNPEMALKEGIVNGMLGAFLGPVFHVISKKPQYNVVRDAAIERARDDMFSSLLKDSPEVTIDQMMKGTNFLQIGAKNLSEGQGFIFHDVPDHVQVSGNPEFAGRSLEQLVSEQQRAAAKLTDLRVQSGLGETIAKGMEVEKAHWEKYHSDLVNEIAHRENVDNIHVREENGKRSVLIVGKALPEASHIVDTGPTKVELDPTVVEQLKSEFAKTSEGTVGAKMDPSLLKKLGANMYKHGLVNVIIKEGLQNAVDALRDIRGVVNPEGRINIDINRSDRQITFTDNGVGMSPEVAANQFMDVGGSFKQGMSAGGYGLAKVGLLANAEFFKMETVKDGIKTTISGSADDWARGNLKYTNEPSQMPSGTKLQIKLEPEVSWDHWEAEAFLKRSIKWSRNLNVRYDGPVENYDSIRDAEQLGEPAAFVHEPNASLEFYHSKNNVDRQGGWADQLPVHVLNRGVYQFTIERKVKGPTPEYLVVDVGAKVGVDDMNYPFTTSREELKAGADKAVDKYVNNIIREANRKNAIKLVQTVVHAPPIPGTPNLRVIDTSMRATSEQLRYIANSTSTRGLARAYNLILTEVGKVLNKASARISPINTPKFDDFVVGGISVDQGHFGVNIHGKSLLDIAKDANIDSKGLSDRNIIYINPFTTYEHGVRIDNLEPGMNGTLPDILSSHSIGTMIHEVVHEWQRNHDEAFSGALTRAVGIFMTDYGVTLRNEIKKAWTEAIASDSFHENYNALQNIWKQEASDAFKSITVHDETPANAGSGERSNGTGSNSEVPKGSNEVSRGTGARPEEVIRHGESTADVPRSELVGNTEELVKHWKETGFIPNQLINFKGVDHQYLRNDKRFAYLRDLTTGKEKKVSLKQLEPQNGRVVQVEYTPAGEQLIGKRFERNDGRVAVLSKNTKPGEKPWRVSYFTKDDQGNIQPYIHNHFNTPEEATKFVTSKGAGTGWVIPSDPNVVQVISKNTIQGEPPYRATAFLMKKNEFGRPAEVPAPFPHQTFNTYEEAVANLKQAGAVETYGDKISGYTEVQSISQPTGGQVTSRIDSPFQSIKYSDAILKPEYLEAVKESPDDYAIYKNNIETEVNRQVDVTKKVAENLASYRVAASRNSDGSYDLRDASGRNIGNFDSIEKLYEYALNNASDGGNLIPNPPGIRGVNYDDAASFPLNQKRNLVNALRDWFATRASAFTTPYQYFTTLESKFGRKFFNDLFLPLQTARAGFNVRLSKLADRINPIVARVASLDPERKGHISNAIEAFSAGEILADKPSILARALTDGEKRVGQSLGTNSTKADRVAAYQYLRAQDALRKELAGASKEEAARLEADFNQSWELTPLQQTVVKIFNDVKREDIDSVSLYAVNRLADAIELKSLSRIDYMNTHKFTSGERELVKDIEKVYDELAGSFGIDPQKRLGGYITHAVEYDGKVVDGSAITNSRWLPAKTRDFVYAAVRTGEMQELIRDPGELLKKYVTQGARSEHLYPAITKAKVFLQNALVGLDRGSAEAINSRSTQYMNQILGIMDPEDALVGADVVNRAQGAFINTLNRLGVDESTSERWLKNYFKVSELATQGFKPIAGVRDATSVLMYWFARFGTRRLGSLLSDWNTATSTKGILQERGKIPGLNVEFFTGVDGALKDTTFLDRAAELGFKFSGQPYVYQQFHAMAHINTVKTVLSAAADLESKKITQKQFEKRIGLSTYDAPQAKQFTELLRKQPLDAANYLADITGREIVGYYGMANHPFFMRTKAGKVLGQHGQWPLWMLQNFGRLASQGTRGERVLTAAKIGAMFAAVKLGGQAAGFNLGSWTFSPDNAIFLPGFSSPMGSTAFWGAVYFGSNDPSQQEFAGRMLQRAADPTRSQYFLPIPAQAYNILWGLARSNNNDPLHIVGGQMLGLPINSEEYPKPQ